MLPHLIDGAHRVGKAGKVRLCHRVVLGIDIEHIANDKVGAVLLLSLDEVLDGVWFQQVVRIGEEDEIAGGGV